MNFNYHSYIGGIYDKSFNHKFDMIIKNARHYKRKRVMKIPAQYAKTEEYINNLNHIVYETAIFRRQNTFLHYNKNRYREISVREIKVLRNRIKHQTRCTFERIYTLMRFENEM